MVSLARSELQVQALTKEAKKSTDLVVVVESCRLSSSSSARTYRPLLICVTRATCCFLSVGRSIWKALFIVIMVTVEVGTVLTSVTVIVVLADEAEVLGRSVIIMW